MTAYALPALSDSTLSRYISEVHQFPMLTQEEEYMYAKALHDHDDLKAAEKMVTSHLRLVVKIAMGFRGYGLPLAEMVSEGNIGLMQAVKKFDPEKGFRLSTYAMWWIKASINEYILRSWSLVKMGTSAAQKKLFFNLRRLKSRIKGTDGRALAPEEVSKIAIELDVPEQDVVEMDARMTGNDSSLNATMREDSESQWIDYVEDESANQEELVADAQGRAHQKALFGNALRTLNERERHIIEVRQLSEEPKTLEELSQVYNVSRERIRQIEARAIEKLQESVKKQMADRPLALPAA